MRKKTLILILSGLIILFGAAYAFKADILRIINAQRNPRSAIEIPPVDWPDDAAGNTGMIQYLNAVYKHINDPRCRFMNCATADHLLAQPIPEDFQARYEYYFELCFQLINCGREAEAVRLMEQYEGSADYTELDNKMLWKWHSATAIGYFRYAMVNNCLKDPMEQSCIWPINEHGQFMHLEYVDKSIAAFTKCLELNPHDLSSQWLLNLVYMQIGQYPDKVPAQWLISPDAITSEYTVSPFRNIALGLGVAYDNMCGGVIMDDFTNDGLIDIFTCGWGLYEECYFLINNGDGTFEDHSIAAGLDNYQGGLNIQQTDYNNDGWLDVWILRGAWHSDFGIVPNSLLRNNGDNTFTDVTREVGLFSLHPTQASVWADFNNDGWLDLFIGNEASRKGDKKNDSEMYINNNGHFTNIAKACRMNINSFIKGVNAGDYDNDGDPDLYISKNGFINALYRNETPKGSKKFVFVDVTEEAGVGLPKKSFPCWFFDFNNDGWLDIMTFPYSADASDNDIPAEYLKLPRTSDLATLYINHRDGTFTNIASEAGLDGTFLVMGSSFGDFDLDGFQDLYLGTGKPSLRSLIPNRLFRNDSGKRFQEATTSARVGNTQKGHEVSFADLNNDGYPEIYAQMGGAYVSDGFPDCLFENPADFGNNWVAIDLKGTVSNHPAIGAKVKLTVLDQGEKRLIYEWVNGGSSFGANSLRLEMGIGKAERVEELEVTWPTTGKTQIFKHIPAQSHILITEGAEQYTRLSLPAFQFNIPEEDHMMMMMPMKHPQ